VTPGFDHEASKVVDLPWEPGPDYKGEELPWEPPTPVTTGASAAMARVIVPDLDDAPVAAMTTSLDAEVHRTKSQEILEVAWNMALVQALNPRLRDDNGFNNADFPFAFKLIATEDVQSLSRLLMLYPDQAQARGLELDVLRTFADPTPGGAGATGREGMRIG